MGFCKYDLQPQGIKNNLNIWLLSKTILTNLFKAVQFQVGSSSSQSEAMLDIVDDTGEDQVVGANKGGIRAKKNPQLKICIFEMKYKWRFEMLQLNKKISFF